MLALVPTLRDQALIQPSVLQLPLTSVMSGVAASSTAIARFAAVAASAAVATFAGVAAWVVGVAGGRRTSGYGLNMQRTHVHTRM